MKFFLEFKFLGLREHCLFRPGSIIGHQQDWLQDKQEEPNQTEQRRFSVDPAECVDIVAIKIS